MTEQNKNAMVVPPKRTVTVRTSPESPKKPPEAPTADLNQPDTETPKPQRKRPKTASSESQTTSKSKDDPITQENIDSQQQTEFITEKFSKNLESIGDILRTSVTAQNKAVKSDLDKVEKTYSNFINATKTQKAVLDKASSEQQAIFKNLTKQFMDYREDENADAERFHKDLMATLQELHAVGGNEDAIKSIEALIRQGMESSKVDPNKAKYDKKWEMSAKDKEHWSYKLFGGEPEKKSNISQEEIAIASGKAENLAKGLFGQEAQSTPEVSKTDKLLEAILKNTSKGSGIGGGAMPTKIDKLLVSKLVVDKIDERIGKKKKDKEKVNHEPIHQPDIEINPKPEHHVEKNSDVEDVDFREVPKAKPIQIPHIVPEVKPAEPKQITHVAPVVQKPAEPKLEHKPEPKPLAQKVHVPEIKRATEPVKQVHNLKTKVSPMAQAVRSAVSDMKQPMEKPAQTISQVAASPTPSPDLNKPLAKEETPQVAPEAEKDSGFGLADLASMVPTKGLGKLGKVALKGGGKLLGKLAAPVAAGVAAYGGIKDELDGKHVESLSDIIPEDNMDKLNPFSYLMNTGRYVGNKIYKGIGAASNALGGSGDLGGDIYDWTHPSKPEVKPAPSSPPIVPPVKATPVEAKPTASPNVTALTEEAKVSKQAEKDAKTSAPVVINSGGTSGSAPAQNVTNYMPVTGAPRSRENHFDRAMGRSFTGI